MRAATRRPRAHRVLLVAAVIAALVALGVPTPASASLIGELSGTVTGGGAPLPNVWVTLTPVTDQGNPTGAPRRTLTDESGRYEFPEVYDRAVKVQVRAPLFDERVDTYWPDAHSFAQAGIIEISSWPVTADVDLPVGGSVSGRVVDAETGAAVPDARVTAVISASPSSGAVGVSDRAEGPGAFALSGLPPDPLTLRVRLPAGSPYLSVGPEEPSQGVRVDGSRATSEVVIGLRRAAEIRGTVRDDTGAPVAGAQIKLVGCVPNCPLLVTSDESGAYRMRGVAPGTRLGVVAWKGDQLLKQWYPRRGNASQASDISLVAGEVLEDIDFALTRGAFMTVGVRSADADEPLTGAIVQLISSTDPFERYFALRSTDGPGRMRLGPVPPGSYVVRVTPGASNPDYLPVIRLLDAWAVPRGVIDLAAEDDLELVAELPPIADPGPDSRTREAPTGSTESQPPGTSGCRRASDVNPWPTARSCQGGREAWPGLARGFLADAT